MGWLYVIIAGSFEVLGVIGMNRISRKKNFVSILVLILGFVCSFSFLSLAMESLSMGTAYAVWTGIGTVGGVLIGMLFYGESRDWKRILFMSMVVAAAIGLKIIS
ncbi:paired small multidrug resistance pump [Fictibacillus solisalsi]|uniref:Paired small multidrug resistance pump n=1 Tax=Fictibacillus solisalsi TaxID=459525 RepID=A0A1G9ZVB8_9BACL|nr:multidrug efflux SMR transporter [Fictibacillus solisalsi]SDN25168.1 paired small multidrug resistance pump [Fictibacillus solisalsi]